MSARKTHQRNARNGRTNAQKREAVLAFLNHPTLSLLSDREVSRRTRVSQPFVSTLRKMVISQGGSSGSDVMTRSDAPTPGSAAIISDLPLNSLAWSDAEPIAQQKFVDGVGLRSLYEAARPDQRDALLAWLLAQLRPGDRPEQLPPNVMMYLRRFEGGPSGDGLDIPPHLRRSGSEGSR
jgi:hypothetical protein